MDTQIINHKHYRDFTIIPNDLLQCGAMTFAERGLLCYLLSLPVSWEIRVSVVAEKNGETERTILRLIKGLIELGYCKRETRRVNGKLAGQRYIITDIPNDFTAPPKIEGAGEATMQNSRPTEIPAPQKNGGAYKEPTLFNKENIIKDKERETHTRERNCLFEDSKYYDYELFREILANDPEVRDLEIDFNYYYMRIKNWSAANGEKKKDWIATAKNWMLSDARAGKLAKVNTMGGGGLTAEEIAYLKM